MNESKLEQMLIKAGRSEILAPPPGLAAAAVRRVQHNPWLKPLTLIALMANLPLMLGPLYLFFAPIDLGLRVGAFVLVSGVFNSIIALLLANRQATRALLTRLDTLWR